jgi:hypothetical protein
MAIEGHTGIFSGDGRSLPSDPYVSVPVSRPCSVDGCKKPAYTGGLCLEHGKKAPEVPVPPPLPPALQCITPGCNTPKDLPRIYCAFCWEKKAENIRERAREVCATLGQAAPTEGERDEKPKAPGRKRSCSEPQQSPIITNAGAPASPSVTPAQAGVQVAPPATPDVANATANVAASAIAPAITPGRGPCLIPGCGRPAKGKGLCPKHYQAASDGRLRAGHMILVADPPRRATCAEPGCVRPLRARGLCSYHYGQARKHGRIPRPAEQVSLVLDFSGREADLARLQKIAASDIRTPENLALFAVVRFLRQTVEVTHETTE